MYRAEHGFCIAGMIVWIALGGRGRIALVACSCSDRQFMQGHERRPMNLATMAGIQAWHHDTWIFIGGSITRLDPRSFRSRVVRSMDQQHGFSG